MRTNHVTAYKVQISLPTIELALTNANVRIVNPSREAITGARKLGSYKGSQLLRNYKEPGRYGHGARFLPGVRGRGARQVELRMAGDGLPDRGAPVVPGQGRQCQ